MFRDRQKELRRLEEALLAEEEYDIQPPEADPESDGILSEDILDELLEDTGPAKESVAYQNFSNAYGKVYNSDHTDVDMEEYCEEVQRNRKSSLAWLIVI
jgi:hypothetical protein